MTYIEFYRKFAQDSGIPIYKCKAICNQLFKTLADCIKNEDRVIIKDFGVFGKKTYKGRKIGRLWGEGEFYLPETTRVVFNPLHIDLDEKDEEESEE